MAAPRVAPPAHRPRDTPLARVDGARLTDVIIAGMSLNHLGTAEPPPLTRTARRGYVACFEAVLEDARSTDTPGAAVPWGRGRHRRHPAPR